MEVVAVRGARALRGSSGDSPDSTRGLVILDAVVAVDP